MHDFYSEAINHLSYQGSICIKEFSMSLANWTNCEPSAIHKLHALILSFDWYYVKQHIHRYEQCNVKDGYALQTNIIDK